MKSDVNLKHIHPRRQNKHGWVIGMFVVVACIFTAVVGKAEAQSGALPPGPYESVVRAKCTTCHVAAQVVAQRRNAGQWAQVVESMILQGAQITDDEFDQIVMYLASNFGPEPVVEEAARQCSSGGHHED